MLPHLKISQVIARSAAWLHRAFLHPRAKNRDCCLIVVAGDVEIFVSTIVYIQLL